MLRPGGGLALPYLTEVHSTSLATIGRGRPRAMGITGGRVLAALEAVPRAAFVPAHLRARATENAALPIGRGQTISQPQLVRLMCELLDLTGTERVLDVGTGSGYHAAVLARLAAHVFSVEIDAELAAGARRALAAAGTANVTCVVGDGTLGLPERAPFEAINVAAAAPEERLATLAGQLAPGGRLVAPVGNVQQVLVVLTRTPAGLQRSEHGGVRFVPLV